MNRRATRVHVGDRNLVGAREDEWRVLGGRHRTGQRVHRTVVHSGDVDEREVPAAQRAADAGRAVVVGPEIEIVGRGGRVGGDDVVQRRAEISGEQVVDLREIPRERQPGRARAAHADAGRARRRREESRDHR